MPKVANATLFDERTEGLGSEVAAQGEVEDAVPDRNPVDTAQLHHLPDFEETLVGGRAKRQNNGCIFHVLG